MQVEPSREIRTLFGKLARALANGDVQAYRQLVNGPDPFQEELFLQKSLHLRESRLHAELRHVEAEHDTARVHFDVLNEEGHLVEHSSLTVVQETLGWFIEEL